MSSEISFYPISKIEYLPPNSRVLKEVVGLSAQKVRFHFYIPSFPLFILERLICIRVGALTSGRGSRYGLLSFIYFILF